MPQGPSQNPYLFIVGSPRSGTTLLQRLVDAHSQIAVPPESQWIVRFYNRRIGLTPQGQVTPALIAQLLAHPKFPHLGIKPAQLQSLLAPDEQPAYACFVRRVFDACGRARGKPLVGDKTPNYVRQIDVLHTLWPRARFVHLIRDGRDVCLSLINWKRKAARMGELFPTWQDDPVTTTALCWERDVRHGCRQGRALASELYSEVRYESLVSQPAGETARLCSFLGVPYEEDMLHFYHGHARSESGLSAKEAWLPITPGLRDWKTQMPPADVERFEAIAGGLLGELGYPRGCPSLTPAARQRAAHLRQHFEQALAARGAARDEVGA